MTRDEIISILATAKWPAAPRFLDGVYDPVSADFVKAAWAAAVANLPQSLRTSVDIGGGMTVAQPLYIAGVFNCNKMARWLSAFVDICAASDAATKGIARNSPAFGPMSYFIGGNPADGHDIDWYVDYSGVLHYFEKQTGSEVTLTEVEVASIFFAEAA